MRRQVSRTDPGRVTVKDVANRAGVSTATVTRTFQDADSVLPETRERVMAAVAALGYRPNPMARDLRYGGRSSAVGLAISSFTNAFQTGVAAGAERELRRHGVQLLIGSVDLDPGREPELVKAMVDRRVSALMVIPDGPARDFLAPERLFGTPVVLVGRPADGVAADVVMTEDDLGVEQATDQLIDSGHRRIAILAGERGFFRTRQRLAGFRASMARHGLVEHDDLVVMDLLTADAARTAVEALFRSASPPTAIVALNLGISNGVLIDRIRNHRTCAYIAVDESELSAGLDITAVVRDPEELGRVAAELAMARIDSPDRPITTVTLPSHLVRRGSGELLPPG